MRQMKDSGIEWIGEIPIEWSIIPNKYLMYKIKHICPIYDGGDILSLTMNGVIVRDLDAGGKMPQTFDGYQYIKSGNLLMCLFDIDVTPRCVGLIKSNGLTSPAYSQFQLKSIANPDYYCYYYTMLDNDKTLLHLAKNLRHSLTEEQLGNISTVVPPLWEQEKIASYLDCKCSEIDALATDIQNEIETLEEYKRSVITEAVTKGLDPDVEMKDSGVEWIEDIPQGWEINRIKYLFSNGKGLPITKENLIDEGLSVISYGQIHAKFNTGVDISNDLIRFVSYNYERLFPQCKVFQYDFVFADTSEDYDGCGNCVYKRDDSLLYAGYHTIILHSLLRNDNRYFAYLFQTDLWRKQIRCAVSGVKVFSITQKIIMNAQVLIPSPKEQRQIADYLDKKCSEIDNVIKEKQQQLETLAEYKKSLIYEYVTGKKEVI